MRKQVYSSLVILALVLSAAYGSCLAQSKPVVSVEGEVLKTLKLTADDLARFNPAEVKAKDKEGKEHIFKGVRLVDVLDSAGVTLGVKLRGENLVKYVRAKAADDYEVVFSLAEIDPEFTSQIILLAVMVDGKALPKGEGPFRLVVPNDKKQARWIRELTTIDVVFSKE